MLRKRALALAAVVAVVGTAVGVGTAMSAADEVGPLIVGGHEATGDTGWMVSLQYDAPAHDRFDWHTCGGSLSIARDTVITAAHCVTDPPPAASPAATGEATATFAARWRMDAGTLAIPVADKQYKVRIGSKDRAEGGELVPVVSITHHPDWAWGMHGPGKAQADIAVLRLAHRVNHQPVQLGSPGRPGENVSVYGWGIDSPDSAGAPNLDPLPRRLQELDTRVIANARCASAEWSPQDICVDNPYGTDGMCSGDSGSPAIRYTRHGVPEFVGVVSRRGGQYCGSTPSVFTSAPAYRTWLYDVVRGVPGTPAVTVPANTAPPHVTAPVTQPGERP